VGGGGSGDVLSSLGHDLIHPVPVSPRSVVETLGGGALFAVISNRICIMHVPGKYSTEKRAKTLIYL
ncbi:hypothetical protein RQ832_31750, partial [Roseomonas sp. DSM 102946]|nr:hypothetical protein [Roseomonas sp. DSM 102946]